MKIGIVGPSRGEVARIIEALDGRSEKLSMSMPVIAGTYGDNELVIALSGIATVNASAAATLLAMVEKVDMLMVCGVAGGIDPELEIGDTVVCEALAYHDMDSTFIINDPPYFKSPWLESDQSLCRLAREVLGESYAGHRVFYGKAVTGDYFVADEGREGIIEKFDPLCTDMETTAVAHVAYMAGLPFIAFRSMTDTATHSGLGTFHEHYLDSSATVQACTLAFLKQVKA